ncbi:hypothetical protein NQ317_011439 [Molorchus minor]|uniref:Uncharacterized protein n=1 Tax=Molorchus minor TaxID=1323400 RepID=A0ABQ9IZ13_9CUCU|nr:hypothetical protein NQ317_011439 [Molorchus minor]
MSSSVARASKYSLSLLRRCRR